MGFRLDELRYTEELIPKNRMCRDLSIPELKALTEIRNIFEAVFKKRIKEITVNPVKGSLGLEVYGLVIGTWRN